MKTRIDKFFSCDRGSGEAANWSDHPFQSNFWRNRYEAKFYVIAVALQRDNSLQ
jgi:hypothetical protein